MIEPLSPPQAVQTPQGEVTATHRAWSMSVDPLGAHPVTSRAVLGIVQAGVFVPLQGGDEVVLLDRAEYQQLAAPKAGKPAGVVRSDDVVARHHQKRGRA